MPRKKKDNLISLAKKTNDASLFSTRDLLHEIIDSDLPEQFEKCVCILANEIRDKDGAVHKFAYHIAGFKSNLELLGILETIKYSIINGITP